MISLTQSTTPIIGQVAWVLGKIMNALFQALEFIGIPNIGLAIILFTIVVKLLMMPLTYKQQKFSKLTSVMNPEIQAVTKKYKGKKDQESMERMRQEQQMIYEKYGTSPTGGCLQLVIQMPILYALYKVVQNIPAYVPSLKVLYTNILSGSNGNSGIMSTSGFADTMSSNFGAGDYSSVNSVIDVMTKFGTDKWNQLSDLYPNFGDMIHSNVNQINHINNFLGVNMAQSPGLVFGLPILIPILAGFTQWVSVKLTQAATPMQGDDNPAAASMKMMTTVMPLMSAFFAISLPAGLGIYWIAQAVVQVIIQLILNRHFDRMGVDAIVKANVEKQTKKREKKGIPPKTISNNAKTYTKNVDNYTTKNSEKLDYLKKKRQEQDERIKELKQSDNSKPANAAKSGSLAEKAGMVSKYNQKNTKK